MKLKKRKRQKKMLNIYDYPELYFFLFKPEPLIQKWAEENLHHYFPNGVDNFLEPACGPGYWINKIKSNYFLGVDINPKTISWAKGNTEKKEGDFLIGDMRHLEECTDSKFDLVLNLESTIGHLDSISDVCNHLKSVRKVISKNGYYFLGVPLLNDYFQDEINLISYKTNSIKLKSGGSGVLKMSSNFVSNTQNVLRLSYEIRISNSSKYESKINCFLDLKSFDSIEITQIIKSAGFIICKVNYMQFPETPSSKSLYNLGLVSLILKPIN